MMMMMMTMMKKKKKKKNTLLPGLLRVCGYARVHTARVGVY